MPILAFLPNLGMGASPVASAGSVDNADIARDDVFAFPPIPGSPWAGLYRPGATSGARGLAVGIVTPPIVPAVGGPPPLLIDEGANTVERLRYAVQIIARYINPLIRKGQLALAADGDADIVLETEHITDALGYTPADAATPIVGTTGINAGGTIGSPDPISVDDTILRLISLGSGQNLVFIPTGVAPGAAENPTSGTLLYSDGTSLLTRNADGSSGAV